MKFLPLALILFTSCPAFSSDGHQSVLARIDTKLQSLTGQVGDSHKVETLSPWSVVDARESGFWQAVTEGYNLLMANRQKERYNFLYEASRASSKMHPERISALNDWLKTENKRIYGLGLSFDFYEKWKLSHAKISKAIQELAKERPALASEADAHSALLENKAFLEDIKQDLIKENASGIKNFNFLYAAIAGLICFGLGLLFSTRKQTEVHPSFEELPPLPELPEEVEEAFNNDRPVSGPAVSLEEVCRNALSSNRYLLELSQIKVNVDNRSPFKTTVNASENKIAEALQWLVKGTIALVNTAKAPVSHLDWKCKEQNGRVSLEFILHGVEVDQRQLYQNAVIDGDRSACAHFGRSENVLNGHQPVIAYRIGNKKTTISLGLETNQTGLNH